MIQLLCSLWDLCSVLIVLISTVRLSAILGHVL